MKRFWSAPKEDSTISSAELMSSTTLSLPEFIQSAEPKAEQFLEKVRKLEMPATDLCRGGRQASISPDGGQPRVHQTWGSLSLPSLYTGLASQIFQAVDRWPPGDFVGGPPEAPSEAGFCGVNHSPGPRMAPRPKSKL